MALQILKLMKNNKCNGLKSLSGKSKSVKTAGIIVIGDEILKGAVLDTNSNYISKALYKLGVKVNKISVVGDVVEEISEEVKNFSKSYDYVITTGGIGPTHDDVTFEAVGRAFNEELIPNPILMKICKDFYTSREVSDSEGFKLAYIPKSARLTYGEDKNLGIKLRFPNVSIKNVYIFPGIPEFLQKGIDVLANVYFKTGNTFYSKNLYLNIPEYEIVSILNTVVRDFPNVLFGSYPELQNSLYKVKITIESTDEEKMEEAFKTLLKSVPCDCVVSF